MVAGRRKTSSRMAAALDLTSTRSSPSCGRGVLLDIARPPRQSALPADFVITPRSAGPLRHKSNPFRIDRAMYVLLRTGWHDIGRCAAFHLPGPRPRSLDRGRAMVEFARRVCRRIGLPVAFEKSRSRHAGLTCTCWVESGIHYHSKVSTWKLSPGRRSRISLRREPAEIRGGTGPPCSLRCSSRFKDCIILSVRLVTRLLQASNRFKTSPPRMLVPIGVRALPTLSQ